VREDDGGDVVVAELVVLEFRRTKEAVGEPSPCGDGDRGQEPPASDVPDGRDTGDVGVLVLVDDNVAPGGGLDTEILQTEFLGVSLATNCPQENVCLDLFARVCVDDQISGFTLDLCDLGLSMYFDASVLHPWGEDTLDGGVESSEDGVATDEEMGFGPEGVEDTGKFYSDVTSTDDDDSFRLVFKFKETIGGDAEASSRDFLFRGDGGMTADSDADVISLEGVGLFARVRDPNLGRGKDGSVTVEKVDTLPVPVALVDTTKFLNVSVALRLEG